MTRMLVVLLLLLAPVMEALAGRSCQERPLTIEAARAAFSLAESLQSALSREHQHRAAILARVGADVSRYGLRYTHAALAYRESAMDPWIVYHKLNECGVDRAHLYEQGLANFLLDDPSEYRVLLIIPNAEMQAGLVSAVHKGVGSVLHEPRYSLIAYPYSETTQNSNSWLLELIAIAESDAEPSRRSAHTQLRLNGYRPYTLSLSPLERVGATLFRGNVSFLDHPLAERLQGRYSVVSVESIRDYLKQRSQLTRVQELAREPLNAAP